VANIPIKMVEAVATVLHTPNVQAIPQAFQGLVANAKWGVFKGGTPDACRYVDITFHEEGKTLRFVVQNKNKRYTANDYAVKQGKATIGQLKPYAVQALGGAQITWVIANPYAPGNDQSFLGHVFNGEFKPKQNNAYTQDASAGATAEAAGAQLSNLSPELVAMLPTLIQVMKNLQKGDKTASAGGSPIDDGNGADYVIYNGDDGPMV
jgi:hypothetical protein